MKRSPRIRILSSDVGLHPESLALNPRFRADVPRLKLEVEIAWSPRDPCQALDALESALVEIFPGLRLHECRGALEYHILRGSAGEPHLEAAESDVTERARLEAPLAAAHLLEHVLIDVIVMLTGESQLSGATGARHDSRRVFDIFVECPDAAIVPLVVHLGVGCMTALLNRRTMNGSQRAAFEIARHLYSGGPHGIQETDLGRLPHSRDEIQTALHGLEQAGLVRRDAARVRYVRRPDG